VVSGELRKHLLHMGLKFSDEEVERRFEVFYSRSFAGFARRMLLLAAALVLGDFLVDVILAGNRATSANWQRLTVVLPLLGAVYWLSSFEWFQRRWQAYMSLGLVLVSGSVFFVLKRIEQEGGYGLSSMVGVLNLTFAGAFCFVVLGIQFRFALLAGLAALAQFLLLLPIHSGLGGDGPVYAYHVITLFLLLTGIGWAREKYIRRDFFANLTAEHEREKADRILFQILPRSIGDRVKNGEFPIAESHGEVSILFADLQGFTQLASRLGPKHLVELLNRIFGGFDEICDRLGIEKIKTIGDAYMGVCGLPEYRDDHALQAVIAGREMVELIQRLATQGGLPINVRVGVHTGPVISGVIGTRRYHYDLWGDAVNIASRMEASGLPGRVHVSEATYWRAHTELAFECRGEIDVKGKGAMTTYLLHAASNTEAGVPGLTAANAGAQGETGGPAARAQSDDSANHTRLWR